MTTEPDNEKDTWWFVDSHGRNIGYMWPEDMKSVIDSVWGMSKGITQFARYTGYSIGAIERYCNGRTAIPRSVAVLVHLIQREAFYRSKQTARRNTPYDQLPKIETPWLDK